MLAPGCLILLLLAINPGPSSPELLAQAEAAVAEGLRLRSSAEEARPYFRQAALLYEELRQRGFDNPDLLRNLGNCWLLADDLPRAIFTYRQGLRRDPLDANLRACLAGAREQVIVGPDGLGRPPIDSRPPWLARIRPEWLAWTAFLAYCLTCWSVTRWWMTRRPRLATLTWVGLLSAIMASAGLVLSWQADQREHGRPMVVIAEDGVLLRKGNSLAFSARYETPVNRGVEGQLLFTRGDWVQMELAGGETGWVPRRFVLLDEEGFR